MNWLWWGENHSKLITGRTVSILLSVCSANFWRIMSLPSVCKSRNSMDRRRAISSRQAARMQTVTCRDEPAVLTDEYNQHSNHPVQVSCNDSEEVAWRQTARRDPNTRVTTRWVTGDASAHISSSGGRWSNQDNNCASVRLIGVDWKLLTNIAVLLQMKEGVTLHADQTRPNVVGSPSTCGSRPSVSTQIVLARNVCGKQYDVRYNR